jgi:hypothetical protein
VIEANGLAIDISTTCRHAATDTTTFVEHHYIKPSRL